MITYFQNRQFRRACAAMLLFGSIAGDLRADSILFTPPAVPLEAPPKLEEVLPNARPDQLDFAAPSQGPVFPQRQMFQRQQPREYDPDDEEMKHPLLRDPKKMPDPLTKLVPKSRTEKWLDKVEAKKKDERKDSLSPVTTFDWREESRLREGLGRKDLAERQTLKKDREDERDANPFRLGKDQDPQKVRDRERNNFQSMALNAPSAFDQREKSILANAERRATAFDELLNPQPATEMSLGRPRSSLEPVTGFDSPKPVQPTVTTPPPVGQQVVRAPLDPTRAFEERQQRRLQSSVLDDMNAKFGPQTKASSSKPTTEPAFSTPLLRQPLTRDFPARSF
jgi:hypothetical protein